MRRCRSLGADEVLVRIHAAGVNPVETYIRAGTYARKPALPFTPGNDGAGVVERGGRGGESIPRGDRVYLAGSSTGTYAEYAVSAVPHVHRLPEKISFPQGAAVGTPYATAYRGLIQRGGAKPNETVLVHGASGGVGTAAVQLARARGIRVFGTAGSGAVPETGHRTGRRRGVRSPCFGLLGQNQGGDGWPRD